MFEFSKICLIEGHWSDHIMHGRYSPAPEIKLRHALLLTFKAGMFRCKHLIRNIGNSPDIHHALFVFSCFLVNYEECGREKDAVIGTIKRNLWPNMVHVRTNLSYRGNNFQKL